MVDQLSAGGRAIPNPAVPKEGVQDQSSSNRHWSNGTSQQCAILPPAMRNTATVCQVRSWPLRSSWGRPAAPPAGRHELVPSFLTGEDDPSLPIQAQDPR